MNLIVLGEARNEINQLSKVEMVVGVTKKNQVLKGVCSEMKGLQDCLVCVLQNSKEGGVQVHISEFDGDIEAEEAYNEENFASFDDQEQNQKLKMKLAEEGIDGDTIGEALVI